MDTAETIATAGLIIAVLFGAWGIFLSYKQMRELNDVSKGTKNLVEVTKNLAEGINNLARGTLEAIQQDGVATRQAIVDVHKSIKEELDKERGSSNPPKL